MYWERGNRLINKSVFVLKKMPYDGLRQRSRTNRIIKRNNELKGERRKKEKKRKEKKRTEEWEIRKYKREVRECEEKEGWKRKQSIISYVDN